MLGTYKNALLGRFFVSVLLLSPAQFMVQALAEAEAPSCTAPYNTFVAIDYVIDGDTVITTNGDKIRLIGIDTPELGKDGKPDEPGAVDAHNFLRNLLHLSIKYPIAYDKQRHDHYGRWLAHLFLPDGKNVQSLMLVNGLATPLTIPPNLRLMSCYQHYTAVARSSKLGIWNLPQYQAIHVSKLRRQDRGYRIIEGRITSINTNRSSLWINLSDIIAVRIARADLGYFSGLDLSNLVGNYVQIRGKLYFNDNGLRMRIRHQVDIEY